MQRFFSNLLLLCTLCASLSAQTGSLKGIVFDQKTREPLIGANVMLAGTQRGTATDAEGAFEISGIKVGGYALHFSMIGYEQKTVTDKFITVNRTTYVNVGLRETILESGEEVVVTARSYFTKADQTPVSARMLNYEEIRRSPGAREDINRMIQNLPGVNHTSDDRNDLVVRGGSPSEVLFLVDNIEVPNPNHFGTQGATGGPISMLNTEFIKQVNFMAGGFPVKYGNKVSAVLDVEYRQGNPEHTTGKFDLNFAGAGGNFDGSFANGKGRWMLAGHRSFLDFMEDLIDVGGIPVYSNLQFKTNYKLDQNTRISVLGIGGDDHITVDWDPEIDNFAVGETDTVNTDHVVNKTRQFTLGMNVFRLWNEKLFSNWTISHSYNRFFIDFNIRNKEATRIEGKDELNVRLLEHGNQDVYDNVSTEQTTNIKTDWTFLAHKQTTLNWGLQLKLPQFEHETAYKPYYLKNSVGGESTPSTVSVDQNISPKVSGYLSLTQHLTPKLAINLGVRYDYFDLLKTTDWAPRLSVNYDLTKRLSLALAAGRFYQSPEYIYITGDPENATRLTSMGADHFVAGFDYLLTEATLFSIEVYHKNYFDYPVSAELNYDFFSTANSGAEYGSVGGGELISKGTGRATGIEFFLQKKLISGLYGLASYTLSEIEHKALDGVYRPGAFDSPHVANIVIGYRLNKSWEFSVKWRYASGRPYTPYDRTASIAAGRSQIDVDQINGARFEPYHRFDFRYDYRKYYNRFTLVTYFSIENIYNRDNQGHVFWNEQKRVTEFSSQTGFFPVVGVSLEF